MEGVVTKQIIVKAMEDLPEDATIEDAMERLYVLHKIDRGLHDVAEGKTVSLEEARARLSKWLR